MGRRTRRPRHPQRPPPGGWAPKVSDPEQQALAQERLAALRKSGYVPRPVILAGQDIARTFWGRAWCNNLRAYSDYANRLPRGETYVRNGSVLDLHVELGSAKALVSGTEVYRVKVDVKPAGAEAWQRMARECAGKIDSVAELLAGKLSPGIVAVLSRRNGGLFPTPREITFDCSCPDVAEMCKHVAAVLYGVGARLDEEPSLLFTLRGVDQADLVATAVASAAASGALTQVAPGAQDAVLGDAGLSELFGIELVAAAPTAPSAPAATPAPAGRRRRHRRSRGRRNRPEALRTEPAVAALPAAHAAPAPLEEPVLLPRVPRRLPATMTSTALLALGVPQATLDSWLASGVLLPTGRRGIYGTTPALREHVLKAQGAPPDA